MQEIPLGVTFLLNLTVEFSQGVFMKFRKKPIIIEAEQWQPGKKINGVWEDKEDVLGCKMQIGKISTLEGIMMVSPGDWIITGCEGEKYAIKDRIFKKTYEKVEE